MKAAAMTNDESASLKISDATMPLVSIVMPAYNAARWISETIESVLAQTYDRWELIVVDDGSTDMTKEVVDRYASYLRFVGQQNQGAPSARNRGLKEAKGDYYLFLDADDLLAPDALDTLVGYLETHTDVDVAYGDGFLIDEAGTQLQSLQEYRIRISENMLEQFVISGYIGFLGVVLFRYSSFVKLKGPFDEDLFAVEDWDLLIRVAAAGCKFANAPKVTGYYRIHNLNTSSPFSPAAIRRNEALIRARLKVLRSEFFDTLADDIRCRFFYSLFMDYMPGRYVDQDQVIASPQFLGLPKKARANLLYYLGISNIVRDGQIDKGRERLRMAVAINPLQVKHVLIYCFAFLGPRSLDILVSLRRRWAEPRLQKQRATVPFRPVDGA